MSRLVLLLLQIIAVSLRGAQGAPPPPSYFYTDFTNLDAFSSSAYTAATWPNGFIGSQGTRGLGPNGYGANLDINPYATIADTGYQGYNDMWRGYFTHSTYSPFLFPNSSGKVQVEASISTSILNTEYNNFGYFVTKQYDDPRLANCQFMLFDPGNAIASSFMWTAEGIWVAHERFSYNGLGGSAPEGQPSNFTGFSNWYRVANTTANVASQVRIVYEQSSPLISYYLNNTLVQSVINGAYPPPNGVNVALYKCDWNAYGGPVNSQQLQLFFGCGAALDKMDPWNPTNPVGLVEYSTIRAMTLPETFFVVNGDTTDARSWGQRATMNVNWMRWVYSP